MNSGGYIRSCNQDRYDQWQWPWKSVFQDTTGSTNIFCFWDQFILTLETPEILRRNPLFFELKSCIYTYLFLFFPDRPICSSCSFKKNNVRSITETANIRAQNY